MRISAQELKRLGLIDRIVPEPLGGAHRNRAAAIETIGSTLDKELAKLTKLSAEEVKRQRKEKFMAMERPA